MTGKELREIRKSLGYTQAELAKLIGLSRDYIGLLERGDGEIVNRTVMAIKALRPKGAGTAELATVDTLERMVEKALSEAGIQYVPDRAGGSRAGLDFYLPDLDVHIEVKRFHSERTAEQIARAANVILLQGERAALMFCLALEGNAGLLSAMMPTPGKPVKTTGTKP